MTVWVTEKTVLIVLKAGENVNMAELTITQKQRLNELNAPKEVYEKIFETEKECKEYFLSVQSVYLKKNRESLSKYCKEIYKPMTCQIEEILIKYLTELENFTQVQTPIIISKSQLEKMTIDDKHALNKQVFWLDDKKCLRPMLAPNLYEVMRDMQKALNMGLKIFECGSCFRKESQGSRHLNEFTMLNLVEFDTVEDGQQMGRLKELAENAMKALEIDNYELEITSSEVYGETLDILVNGDEIASGAYGPHVLDNAWGIFKPWVGIGFGIERIAMIKGGFDNIKRVGRSITYVGGVRLRL